MSFRADGLCSQMNPIKLMGLLLVVAGGLALVYGGFTYTKTTHDTQIGPIELSVHEKQAVNVPLWAGVAAIVLGGVLLVVGKGSSSGRSG